MTNHDLTIWMVFGSVSFIAFMVTLWKLLKANRKVAKFHSVKMQHALDIVNYERLVQEQYDEIVDLKSSYRKLFHAKIEHVEDVSHLPLELSKAR